MSTYNYDPLIARLKKQIEKYGGDVYLKVPLDGYVDSKSGQITYNNVTIPAKGIVTGFSPSQVNNINVFEDDKLLIIDTEQGKPIINNLVEIDNENFRILGVDAINPNIINPIIYRLHVRSTKIYKDFSTFITTLKGLEPGSVIKDPSNPRGYPNWIKLVSDYPKQDITMILEQYTYEYVSYNDVAPSFNRWVLTDLYEYLVETYIYRYSANFYNLLQEVDIVSRDYTKSDKISLPSAEELTGFTIDSENSGTQIPYFKDAPFNRIAIDKDELENVSWWTRDYYGVDGTNALCIGVDGSLQYRPTTYVIAIRACVYMNNNQRVILNDDGETYSLIYN